MTGSPRAAPDALEPALAGLAERSPGTWSFAVSTAGREAGVRADAVVAAASTVKTVLAVAVLREVDAGRLDLGQRLTVPEVRTGGSGTLRLLGSVEALTLGETLTLCLAVSDNTATNMLIDLLGLDALGEHVAALGLRTTALRRRMMDAAAAREGRDNVASAAELAVLYRRVGAGELLTRRSTQVLLTILAEQTANDRIPAGVPPGVEVLHKPGELPGLRHDAGLLRIDGQEIGFAALGSDLPDAGGTTLVSGEAARVIAEAARLTVRYVRQGRAVGDRPAR